MGGRLYDARIGRVLQADPPFMESPFWSQGLNRYSYVFNNPLNATDPSGYLGDEPDESMEEMLERFKEYDREIEERNGSSGDDDGAGIDKDSINDANDDEAETSPGQGDPSDESVVGDAAESLDTDDHLPVPQIPTALDWAKSHVDHLASVWLL